MRRWGLKRVKLNSTLHSLNQFGIWSLHKIPFLGSLDWTFESPSLGGQQRSSKFIKVQKSVKGTWKNYLKQCKKSTKSTPNNIPLPICFLLFLTLSYRERAARDKMKRRKKCGRKDQSGTAGRWGSLNRVSFAVERTKTWFSILLI